MSFGEDDWPLAIRPGFPELKGSKRVIAGHSNTLEADTAAHGSAASIKAIDFGRPALEIGL